MTKSKLFFFLLASSICLSLTPTKRHLIRWQFDKFKKLTFEYTQVSSNKMNMFFGGDGKMVNKASGLLIVTAKNEKFADIVFKDINAVVMNVDSTGDSSVMMKQGMPDMFIQDLREDGAIEGQLNQQTEMLAKMLFPITNVKMKIGDTIDLPMTIPFNLFGSTIMVKGYNRVKCAGIDNDTVQLKSVINVTQYTIPEDVKTKWICYTKGDSRFQFNSAKGFFTEGEVNANMVFRPEKSDDKGGPTMSMDMETTIKLKLIKIE